uniref:Uncharacterized protein n=1 Tax=Rhizophora mucronata TaxID=61149 RepID=A0A2P2NN99_RHIMU
MFTSNKHNFIIYITAVKILEHTELSCVLVYELIFTNL